MPRTRCECGTVLISAVKANGKPTMICPTCQPLTAPAKRCRTATSVDPAAHRIGLNATEVAVGLARVDPAQAKRTEAARARALRGWGKAPKVATPPRADQDAHLPALARRYGVGIRGAT